MLENGNISDFVTSPIAINDNSALKFVAYFSSLRWQLFVGFVGCHLSLTLKDGTKSERNFLLEI